MDLHRLGLVSTRLRYFLAVAECGSIRRAAEVLHVSPSSISRIVQLLEQDLEAVLFERTSRRLRLTEAGSLLLLHGRGSQAELAQFQDGLDALRSLQSGRVVLATVESVARGPLPQLLSGLWADHPGIAVEIRVLGSEAALDCVAGATADLVVAFEPTPPASMPLHGLRRLASVQLALGALMRPDHPLATRATVSMAELQPERLLQSDDSLALSNALEGVVGNDARRPSRTNSIGLMLELAACGAGVAIQTRVGAEPALRRGELAFLRLRARRSQRRVLMLGCRATAPLSGAASLLAARLTRVLHDLQQTDRPSLPPAQRSRRKPPLE